jgi:hypothetical protein
MVGYKQIIEQTQFTSNKILLDHTYLIGAVEVEKTTTSCTAALTASNTGCTANFLYLQGTRTCSGTLLSIYATKKSQGTNAVCVYIGYLIGYLTRVRVYELLYVNTISFVIANLQNHIVFYVTVLDQYGNPMPNETVTLKIYRNNITTAPVYTALPITDINGYLRHDVVYNFDFLNYNYIATANADTITMQGDIPAQSTGTWDGGGGSTHLECVNGICTSVSGAGNDLCSVEGSACTNTHLECVNGICTRVTGTGNDLCSVEGSTCTSSTHLECVNGICTSVSGVGNDLCSVEGSTCTSTHLECVNGICTRVTGTGNDLCSVEGSACTAPSSNNTGIIIVGGLLGLLGLLGLAGRKGNKETKEKKVK